MGTNLTASAANSAAVQAAAASQRQTAAAGSNAGSGIFNWQLPNIMPSLDQFLGLPTVIDYQDIAIRASMVVVGIVLVILVAWSFVRGQQTTNVQVVSPSEKSGEEEAATEAVA